MWYKGSQVLHYESTDLKKFLLGPLLEIAYENEHWLIIPFYFSYNIQSFFREERSRQLSFLKPMTSLLLSDEAWDKCYRPKVSRL